MFFCQVLLESVAWMCAGLKHNMSGKMAQCVRDNKSFNIRVGRYDLHKVYKIIENIVHH